MRVAVITCFPDPDYIRAWTIRRGLADVPSVDLCIVKNRSSGPRRYLEVLWQLIKINHKHQPQLFVITYRGYELLPLVLLLAWRRPVVFDELINPLLVVSEHRLHKSGFVHLVMGLWQFFGPAYYWFLRRCRYVITDTEPHAQYAISHGKIKPDKVIVLPVGTDEALFAPRPSVASKGQLTVFFYGSYMARLHGLDYILTAAQQLAHDETIQFHIIGGKNRTEQQVAVAISQGARITYQKRLPFTALAAAMSAANINIGGPLGLGEQANNVITGKTFQSMAMAKPTIIGANPATRPYFKDKKNCLLIERGSAEALVEAITWAKTHPAEISLIGQAGRQTYIDNFSAGHIRQRLDAMVASLR